MARKMKKVLVLGCGVTGVAVIKFLLKRGIEVSAVDRKGVNIDLCPVFKEDVDIKEHDTLIVSPGISRDHPLCLAALKAGIEILGEIDLAARFLKKKVLAITGTNGKTTVALLVEHILKNSGIKAKAVGNIGVPLISEVFCEADVLIVELSSFQLENLNYPFIDVGIVLNISSDHLDRHREIKEYAIAKFNISRCLRKGGTLYVESKCAKKFKDLLGDISFKTFGFDFFINENVEYMLPVRYKGLVNHDVVNIAAAGILSHYMGVAAEDFLAAVEGFKKPPHRIEFVRKIDGISYYNDSKGTNVESVECAVKSLEGKIVLIAGGVDKDMDFSSWVSSLRPKVHSVLVIGQTAEKLEKLLSEEYYVEKHDSLETAVFRAREIAKDGENVLLSPGCASFDMFTDYAHRGEEFKKIVMSLK